MKSTKFKKIVFLSSCIVFSILFSFFVVAESSVVELEADVTQTIIDVQIDKDYIHLGETTAGYQTAPVTLNLTNKGTRDVQIQPELDDGADQTLKTHLRLNRFVDCLVPSSTGWKDLTGFDWTLTKPLVYKGDPETKTMCLKLDLRDYQGSINEDINIREDLVIWIIPA